MENGILWNISDENIALFKADEIHYRCCFNAASKYERGHDI